MDETKVNEQESDEEINNRPWVSDTFAYYLYFDFEGPDNEVRYAFDNLVWGEDLPDDVRRRQKNEYGIEHWVVNLSRFFLWCISERWLLPENRALPAEAYLVG
ncbi:MAG: hypothetical protein HQM01_04675 [Magnetococcales bacterium]|nr:hypothetical protein [Magnetococcales bacterium]